MSRELAHTPPVVIASYCLRKGSSRIPAGIRELPFLMPEPAEKPSLHSYCLLANFFAIHHMDNLVQLLKCTSSQANVMGGIFKFHPVDFLPRVMRGIPCALPSEEHCTHVHTYTWTSLGDTVALVWLCLHVPHIAPTEKSCMQ